MGQYVGETSAKSRVIMLKHKIFGDLFANAALVHTSFHIGGDVPEAPSGRDAKPKLFTKMFHGLSFDVDAQLVGG